MPRADRDRPFDLMLLHGMCCTGSMWNGTRALYEQRGARVHTPTLKPELRTRARPPTALRDVPFDEYVGDLAAEAERLHASSGKKPAVIGHSMGGLLAQKLAELDLVSAAVLISPSAPAGVRTTSARLLWAGLAIGHKLGLNPRVILPERRFAERMVFNVIPAPEREALHAQLVHESGRAFMDLGNYAIDEQRIRVPLLTVAATQDRLVPAPLVRLTGRKYARVGGELREYASHGHWLPGEPGWETTMLEIFDWLDARV